MFSAIETGVKLCRVELELGSKFFQIIHCEVLCLGKQNIVIFPVFSLFAGAA